MSLHWTQMNSDEKAEAVRTILEQGHISFSYIAEQIPGCTRNAAIGCYHRHRKTMPALPVKRGYSTPAAKRLKAPVMRPRASEAPKHRAPSVAAPPKPAMKLPFVSVEEVPDAEFVPTDSWAIAEARERLAFRKTLDDLPETACHFPTWSHFGPLPVSDERFYCGAPIDDSGHKRYCIHHHRMTSNGVPSRSPSPLPRQRIQR